MTMITLGGVSLGGGLTYKERWETNTVSQQVARTIGGVAVLYHGTHYGGLPITLLSEEDQGFQSLSVVQQVFTMSSVAGAQYLLDFGTTQFSVVFRHSDPPAFEVTPIIPRTVPQSGDYFKVAIKLLTV